MDIKQVKTKLVKGRYKEKTIPLHTNSSANNYDRWLKNNKLSNNFKTVTKIFKNGWYMIMKIKFEIDIEVIIYIIIVITKHFAYFVD